MILPHYPRQAGAHPPLDHPAYRSSRLRHPTEPPVRVPQTLTEVTGPLFGPDLVTASDADLTYAYGGEAIGQRIVVHGRVLDGDGRAVPDTLVEVWQANAAGRYRHSLDTSRGQLDPHFAGMGRMLTDAQGGYRFLTIRPGAYPWTNHLNAWRPAHIHFSLFGRAFTQRLVTQMYFPGDPLLTQDPIFMSIPDRQARQRLICRFDDRQRVDEWALSFTFDLVLRGTGASAFETDQPDRHE